MRSYRSMILAAIAAVFALAAGAALAGSPVNLTDGVAVMGHDPVAYFTQTQPVKGSRDFTATHDGATYWFASAANRDAFKADPAKYAPQFGGYCAYGAAKGGKFEIEPAAFTVVGGKLYLNKNQSVRELWTKDVPGHIAAAEKNWPSLATK